MDSSPPYDVVIVGGGPAGLSAALTFARARKRAALFDAGPRRNAAATHLHNFVTRDGVAPDEFRRVARAQLAPYGVVDVRDLAVDAIAREGELFAVTAGDQRLAARRVLLCTGMIDELPALPGLRELWGHSVFQCPFCHGWEVRDRPFGVLATTPELVEFAFMLAGWSRDLVVFTGGAFPVADEARARLATARIALDERPVRALHGTDGRLDAVELADGERVPRAVLFARPPQRHTAIVASLGLALDAAGYVAVDEQQRTSVDGVYAAGDLTTMAQSAVTGAAAAVMAASRMTHGLTVEALAREAV